MIAQRLDLHARELRFAAFDFLQQGDVGRGFLQPRQARSAMRARNELTLKVAIFTGDCDRDQTEKELPQPQLEEAFGFLIWNEAPTRSSTKSISAPASSSSEVSSITTLTPLRSKMRSSCCWEFVEGETILKARAAAARHGQAQHQIVVAFHLDQRARSAWRRSRSR